MRYVALRYLIVGTRALNVVSRFVYDNIGRTNQYSIVISIIQLDASMNYMYANVCLKHTISEKNEAVSRCWSYEKQNDLSRWCDRLDIGRRVVGYCGHL